MSRLMLHPTAAMAKATISVMVTSVWTMLKFRASLATKSEVIAAAAIERIRRIQAIYTLPTASARRLPVLGGFQIESGPSVHETEVIVDFLDAGDIPGCDE